MNYFIYKLLPVLPPEHHTETGLALIVTRVLELTYTVYDLAAWAKNLGYSGEPFAFNPTRRRVLRAELDAFYAKFYGLTRDELRYIFDTASNMDEDYSPEAFRVLKKTKNWNSGNIELSDFC